MKKLIAEVLCPIRFSEVDSMNIVWHGSYALYLEEAREAFGKKYDFGYLKIFHEGFYAPLVDFSVQYKKPLIYGDTAKVEVEFKNCSAAKICFEYRIYNAKTSELASTAQTTQVFLDKDYQLVLYAPQFFLEWKNKWISD